MTRLTATVPSSSYVRAAFPGPCGLCMTASSPSVAMSVQSPSILGTLVVRALASSIDAAMAIMSAWSSSPSRGMSAVAPPLGPAASGGVDATISSSSGMTIWSGFGGVGVGSGAASSSSLTVMISPWAMPDEAHVSPSPAVTFLGGKPARSSCAAIATPACSAMSALRSPTVASASSSTVCWPEGARIRTRMVSVISVPTALSPPRPHSPCPSRTTKGSRRPSWCTLNDDVFASPAFLVVRRGHEAPELSDPKRGFVHVNLRFVRTETSQITTATAPRPPRTARPGFDPRADSPVTSRRERDASSRGIHARPTAATRV